jgi:hypothetical protein
VKARNTTRQIVDAVVEYRFFAERTESNVHQFQGAEFTDGHVASPPPGKDYLQAIFSSYIIVIV